MAPRAGRRRTTVDEEEDEEASPPPQTQRNRQREATPDDDEDVDMDDGRQEHGSGSLQQLSKGLVRYTLSCEHARKPIKRQDINEKGGAQLKLIYLYTILTYAVLGSHTRLFKDVFRQANADLMQVFGMQMVELPKADRVTQRQKRGGFYSSSRLCTRLMLS